MKILVVDDKEEDLYMLRFLLQENGYQVDTATNGQEALEKARAERPDMIIADILMPVMDGFSLCRRWKRDEGLKEIPFVFYTATYTDPQDEELALSLGAERFIVKPVEPDVFVEMLQEVIREAEAGCLVAPREPVEEEVIYFREYNEALIRKLEDKMLQLEETNRALERDVTGRMRAEEEIHRQRDELATRARIISTMLQTFDLDELLNTILDEIMALLGVEWGGIYLVEDEHIVLRTWRGFSNQFRAQVMSFPRDNLPDWMGVPGVVQERLSGPGSLLDFAKGEGIQAWACVPLALTSLPQTPPPAAEVRGEDGERQWLGVLVLASRRGDALSEDDMRAVESLSEQLALAIDHARRYRDAQERLTRLRVLREIDRAIITHLAIRDILDVILGHVPRELGADAIAISLLGEGQARPSVFLMRLPNGTVIEEEAFTLAESLLHWFVERQEPVIIYDLAQDPRVQMHRLLIHNDNLVSYLGLPLVARQRTIGILHLLTTQPRVFADEDVHFFRTLAGQAAIAIENARLYEAVRQELAERIEAEEALRESEARLAEAQRMAHLGNWDWDIINNELRWSDEIYRIFGLAPQQFSATYEAFLSSVHPNDREFVKESVNKALYENNPYSIDHRIILPDGSERNVHEQAEVFFDETGRPIRMVGTVQDITERKRAERLLQALNRAGLAIEQALTPEEMFAAVAEELKKLGFSCLMLLIDESRSRLFIKHWSYEARAVHFMEKLVGLRIEDFSIPIESADVYQKVIQEKKAVFVEHVEEVTRRFLPEPLKRFAGQIVRTLKISKSIPAPLIVGDEVLGLLAVESDDLVEEDIPAITAFALQMAAAWRKANLMQDLQDGLKELKRTQAELLQAQKMEAIGRLAGGVAHDFNNLLTTIQGYAELIMIELDEADPLYRDLREIRHSAVRAARLTRQLLLFSRRQPMEFVPLNLNRTAGDLLKMLRRLIGEDIAVHTEFEPHLWTIQGDEGNLEQVIMNLAVNARDAMPQGGTLTLRTENVTLDRAQCVLIPQARPGRFVRLSVEDTGVGMDEEVMEHLFEPFFTTKGPGKGTGLGLSVVYGIVAQHEGWINVYSEVGQGSIFRVYLPAYPMEVGGEAETRIPLQGPEGHGEGILLVEDEEGARQWAARVLGEKGYVVFMAAGLEEALDIFEREGEGIHLLFSDMVLPDGTGLQLAGQLLSHKGDLRVLLSSGYTDDRSQWSVIRERGFRFIEKPYSLPDVLQAIREALETG